MVVVAVVVAVAADDEHGRVHDRSNQLTKVYAMGPPSCRNPALHVSRRDLVVVDVVAAAAVVVVATWPIDGLLWLR